MYWSLSLGSNRSTIRFVSLGIVPFLQEANRKQPEAKESVSEQNLVYNHTSINIYIINIYQEKSKNSEVEQNDLLRTENPRVGGSIPPLGIKKIKHLDEFRKSQKFLQ